MAKIFWSEVALNDIQSIHDYIAKDSVDLAALFVERLIEATDRLERFPSRVSSRDRRTGNRLDGLTRLG